MKAMYSSEKKESPNDDVQDRHPDRVVDAEQARSAGSAAG